MNKKPKAIGIILVLALLLSMTALPVFAEETSEPAELHIASLEEFTTFAENCRTDSYSRNLAVYLETDLDLSQGDFVNIPTFSGTFYGNSHTIKGLTIANDGSQQGLFRYLTESAHVQDLTLQAQVQPAGSGAAVGALVGSNAGTVQNCSFTGKVSGTDFVGGLVGTNQLTGLIENCKTEGNVSGSHFVGGIAGENFGVIRQCSNAAAVNTTSHENNVDLSGISVNTITGTEAANTVTDIGGIVGSNSGVIRQCENQADVGYQHMGYNVGGIAGSQKGYIEGCTNTGAIHGRKEVGGIVGQVEPVSHIDYSKDTLQILQDQLTDASALVHKASSNAHNTTSHIDTQMGLMGNHAENAADAITQLVPNKEDPHLPDADTILAAKNTLSSSVHAMEDSMESISSSAKVGVQQLSGDIDAIANQINAIGQTLNQSSQHMGGSFTDISDQDSEDNQTGKITQCINSGAVDGDLNTGGIVGAMAIENDLDPEDDLQFSGSRSLNFEGRLRAVVRDCQNSAPVSGKKDNIGGIVGKNALGLVMGCTNTGNVDAPSADYVGGIAGTSAGFLRSCNAKSQLSGKTCIGGIAGSAAIVTDCRSITHIEGGSEMLGSVIGIAENSKKQTENPIQGNYYLTTTEEYGAVDGINYDSAAQSLPLEEFLALENLPESFSSSTITFLYEDGSSDSVTVPMGSALEESSIPAVPHKDEHTGRWAKLADADLSGIYFDSTFQADYTPYQATVQSALTRESGKPVLLAQGHFRDMDHFEMKALTAFPELSGKDTAVEAFEIPVFSLDSHTQLRLACPEDCQPKRLEIMVRNKDGSWRQTDTEVNGSYLVFSVNSDDDAFCLVQTPKPPYWLFYAVGAVAAAAIVTASVIAVQKKKQNQKQAD